MRSWLRICLVLAVAGPAWPQESPGFKLEATVFNAGGRPAQGTVLSSAGFRVTLDAIGDAAAGPGSAGESFRLDGGFVPAYPPPGEVQGLVFVDRTTLAWSAERSAGVYNLYRQPISNLATLQFGECLRPDLSAPTAADADPVPAADGFFYLATVENRLDEEGTKGFRSDGGERLGTFCP